MATPTTQMREGAPQGSTPSTANRGAPGLLARGRRLLKPTHTRKGLGACHLLRGPKTTSVSVLG